MLSTARPKARPTWRRSPGARRSAHRGARLEERAEAPAEPRGHRLAEERVPDRPLAADAEPGHDARGEERGDLRRQAAEDRPGAVGEDGPLEDRLSPEAVAEVAEERAAHRRRPERRAEQHGMRLAPEAELARDRCEQE